MYLSQNEILEVVELSDLPCRLGQVFSIYSELNIRNSNALIVRSNGAIHLPNSGIVYTISYGDYRRMVSGFVLTCKFRYSVLGIKVGDEKKEVQKVLRTYGYFDVSGYEVLWKKGVVQIYICFDVDNKVTSLSIIIDYKVERGVV